MEFSQLPRLPKLFLDFIAQIQSVRAFLPCRPTPQSLLSHATETRESFASRENLREVLLDQATRFQSGAASLQNIRKLEDATAVAVVTGGPSAFFGGPLCTMFKCLTTIKLAIELEEKGVPAIPVFSLQPDREPTEESSSVWLVDKEGKLRRIGLPLERDLQSAIRNPQSEIEDVLQRAWELCGEAGQDHEFINSLKRIYRPEVNAAIALGRLLSLIFSPWGLVILDTGDPGLDEVENQIAQEFSADKTQTVLRHQKARLEEAGYGAEGLLSDTRELLFRGALLPEVAYVADPPEFGAFALARPLYQDFGLRAPIILPRVSATVIDGRSQKLLKKYDLELKDLYQGALSLSSRLQQERLSPEVADRFDSLAKETGRRLSNLIRALPAGDKNLEETIESSKTKMLYQIQKLREKLLTSAQLRRETIARQIERVCNTLAPDGQPQEQRLGMLYFLLRYPLNFAQLSYDRIDIWKLEHQTILPD